MIDEFDQIFHSMKAHSSYAQVLIEVKTEEKTLEEAFEILRSSGIEPKNSEVLIEGDLGVVKILLSSGDMREAVLKLTEAGFKRVEGINKQHSGFTM